LFEQHVHEKQAPYKHKVTDEKQNVKFRIIKKW